MRIRMKLYRTADGPVVVDGGRAVLLKDTNWDALVARDDLRAHLQQRVQGGAAAQQPAEGLAPIVNQEVWAAGVTYKRSREARMEESKDAGGGDFYDRVYA